MIINSVLINILCINTKNILYEEIFNKKFFGKNVNNFIINKKTIHIYKYIKKIINL